MSIYVALVGYEMTGKQEVLECNISYLDFAFHSSGTCM
jgi:hypothetical protein